MALLIKSPEDVENRLDKLGISEQELRDIVHSAVAAWSRVTEFFPLGASGSLTYHFGSAALREKTVPKGWRMANEDNICSVVNPESTIRLIFQNAVYPNSHPDCEPRFTREKDSASIKMVRKQYSLFGDDQPEIMKGPEVWYFFVSIQRTQDKLVIRAELSRPVSIDGGQVEELAERIVLEPEIQIVKKVGDGLGNINEVKPVVTRKVGDNLE